MSSIVTSLSVTEPEVCGVSRPRARPVSEVPVRPFTTGGNGGRDILVVRPVPVSVSVTVPVDRRNHGGWGSE